MQPFNRSVIYWTIGLLLLALPVRAQEPTDFKLDVSVDLVELHVTVVDDKDRPVGSLKKESFKVLEDKVEQTISVFKHEDIPVSLGLVVDNSRSIEPRKERLDAAALSFVRKSNPDDEAFVVHFDMDARLTQPFTSNLATLEAALASAKPFGQTAIYDALGLALDRMEDARNAKKAILLITDGLDNVSKTKIDDLLERVKRSHVTVYVVGLLSQTEGAKAEATLLRIAEASGGRAYFPENVEQARTMMEGVARDLREQYTLTYLPSNPAQNGAWRSVRVEIAPSPGTPPHLNANYRHGYYGPEK
jgi:Ca-activated chloride channel family protein